MKPKYLFWVCCVGFIGLTIKAALVGDRYVALIAACCTLACAGNALTPGANRRASREELKKLFGTQ